MLYTPYLSNHSPDHYQIPTAHLHIGNHGNQTCHTYNAIHKLGKIAHQQIVFVLFDLRQIRCYAVCLQTPDGYLFEMNLVWPTQFYGAETWTITKSLLSRLDAIEMWVYRRLLKISWTEKFTNEEVLRRMGTGREKVRQFKTRKLQRTSNKTFNTHPRLALPIANFAIGAMNFSKWRNCFKTFRQFGETLIKVLIADIKRHSIYVRYSCGCIS